ncbi:FAD-dependent monooxygenase [Novosphingobium kaempferiae]|uniref:FAD-dependent monooxygenase n=1 Tax=Novosphingobium kaempferiae TaxID=2896849 RepID=UPI001E51803B|nr:FAD-dependent monooxygenase [Novosphingobium kaempferiae]
MQQREIAIIGAGIGGLTLALALRQRGFAPIVYERAPALGEVGAGLTLWPNATKVLASLGLAEELERIGEEPIHQMIRNGETGEVLRTFERKSMMRPTYGAPLLQIHRRDLHDMLVRALEAQAPGSVKLNCELIGIEPDAARPTALFADGARVEADIIVGCDGIRSRVRTELFGMESPRFTQIVAWRGLVPMADLDESFRAEPVGIHIGEGCHVAHYPVRQGSTLNFLGFAVVDGWAEEGWVIPSSLDEMMDRFGHFHPSVTTAMAATPAGGLFKWGLFDRDVREQWSVGAITLLGDAAHPMLPFLGQGAGMVIEDAIVLARLLEAQDDTLAALARYEELRRPRTAYTMLKGRAHAHYYNTRAEEADESTLAMEVDLNEYDAVSMAL